MSKEWINVEGDKSYRSIPNNIIDTPISGGIS